MPKNNVAVITGASSGIGKELAEIHAKRGGDVVLIARDETALQSVKKNLEETYKIDALVIVSDLSEPGAATKLYKEIKAQNIEVSCLINNAGFGGRGAFHERTWEEDESMIRLNIIALSELTRQFLPDFVARNEGKILNTSSTASLIPGPLQAVYFATKAYVTSFSLALSEELHDSAVTVTALLPGPTKTSFAKTADLENTGLFASASDAGEVAKAGYEAMVRGDRKVIAGVSMTQRIMFKLAPLLPMSQLLKRVRKLHEVSK
jgi:short-subunit dehydrogenase